MWFNSIVTEKPYPGLTSNRQALPKGGGEPTIFCRQVGQVLHGRAKKARRPFAK